MSQTIFVVVSLILIAGCAIGAYHALERSRYGWAMLFAFWIGYNLRGLLGLL